MACSLILGACTDEITVNCPTHTLDRTVQYDGYELAWAEEFEKDGLPDDKVWGYEEGYRRNNELQDYKKADLNHSWVEDGKLILQAFKDPHEGTNHWTGEPYHFEFSSASVKSQKKKDFMYGRIDIAAKIPTGRGVWPALWLMPTENIYEDGYGEIDIMEYVWGNGDGHNSVYQTIHTQNTQDKVDERPASWCSSNTLDSKFHLYSVVWEKNNIEILFDNKVILTYQRDKDLNSYKQWPFDQPYYLIMNIAVGGGWGGTWGIDESIFPTRMEVEYVRYYAKVNNGDDEEDKDEDKEEEPVNLIENGDFETVYTDDEKPMIAEDYQIANDGILKYLNHWTVRKAVGTEFFVDDANGANGTKHSLSFKSPKIPNWWSTDLGLAFEGVAAGKHTLSFYGKSDKASSFVLSFTLVDTSIKDYRSYKALAIENGKTVIRQNTSNSLYPTMLEYVGGTWQKYSITLDIPENDLKDGLVKLVIKPHTIGEFGSTSCKLVSSDPVQFWFDEFVLEKAN
jgi:beta-glucanase (GH16 family)